MILLFTVSCTSRNPVCPEPEVPDCLFGQIYVSGNEPFTFLALETSFGTFEIRTDDEELYEELSQRQGSLINSCGFDIELIERRY